MIAFQPIWSIALSPAHVGLSQPMVVDMKYRRPALPAPPNALLLPPAAFSAPGIAAPALDSGHLPRHLWSQQWQLLSMHPRRFSDAAGASVLLAAQSTPGSVPDLRLLGPALGHLAARSQLARRSTSSSFVRCTAPAAHPLASRAAHLAPPFAALCLSARSATVKQFTQWSITGWPGRAAPERACRAPPRAITARGRC